MPPPPLPSSTSWPEEAGTAVGLGFGGGPRRPSRKQMGTREGDERERVEVGEVFFPLF